MRLDWEEAEADEINLAPLIDCVFLLLIFFMVTLKMGDQQTGPVPLPLVLPQARAAVDQDFSVALVIEIDAQGELRVDHRPLAIAELHERLKRLAATNPNAGVRIDADRSTEYKNIAHVLDICEFVGLTNVALGARPVPRAAPALR